jgi:hypothetical protein
MSKDKGLQRLGDLLPAVISKIPKTFSTDIIPPEDIAYTHSIFLQCFMPLRHTQKNARRWQTDHGRASLVIRAGELANPDKANVFKECVVPAGPKARIIAAYIIDFAWRHKTQEVDLGKSLRKFMDKADVKICGSNGRELQRELENFAAAEILLGGWGADEVISSSAKVGAHMKFWLEKDERQRTFWQPHMILGTDFYRNIIEGGHIAPIHWPSYIALQASPRAMDIHSFLTYRLRKPLPQPVRLAVTDLHRWFGKDCARLAHFLPRFEADLKKAWEHYQTARVELTKEADITKRQLILRSSPSLIQHRKVGYLGA